MSMKSKLTPWLIGGILIMVTGFILYKPVIDYLTTQSAKPKGFIGRVMTKIWSSYFKDLSKWSFTHVDLDKHNTILDVGFGGGANIKYIKEHNVASTVYGVDISEEAIKTATEVNQKHVDSGEVILSLGDVADLQFEDEIFDLIVATQTHIYWDDLKKGLSECHKVLKENGILLITSEIDKIEYHLSEYINSDDFVSLLYAIGYKEVNLKVSNKYVAFICTK